MIEDLELWISAIVFVCIGVWLWCRGYKILQVSAISSLLIAIGIVSNRIVKIANGGKFPVSGKTWTEIYADNKDWNYIPGEGAKLRILGDIPELGFASIGDCLMAVGVLVLTISIIWMALRLMREIKPKGLALGVKE